MEVWKEGLSHLKQAESTPLQLLGQINPPKAPKKKKRGTKRHIETMDIPHTNL
jgi:hypothetical protein